MEIAVTGLPGSGKSTVFAALSGRALSSAEQPRRGDTPRAVVKVPDARVEALAQMFNPRKVTPAEVQYVEAPELTHAGRNTEGWSALLTQLRQADAVLLVVRAFDEPSYPHPAGSVDVARDVAEMHSELLLADLITIEKRLERLDRESRGGAKPQQAQERQLLSRCKEQLDKGEPLRGLDLGPAERKLLSGFGFLTLKPLLMVANTGPEGLGGGTAALASQAAALRASSLTLDGKLERELVELAPEEQAEMLAAFGLDEPALARAIRASYALLDLISFFTVGEDEVRAWTVRRGATAPDAAGVIHSDLQRGFIRAEVVPAADLLRVGGMQEAKRQGLLRLEGKAYVVQDGDVISVLFNV
ncbi:MAG: YchF family ATPase [Chloroflexi bacterium]|nr:YchF family ATPase [Chloroflexota bacterium]